MCCLTLLPIGLLAYSTFVLCRGLIAGVRINRGVREWRQMR